LTYRSLKPLRSEVYTLAFYLRKGGDVAEAMSMLRELVRKHPDHVDSMALLGSICEETGRREEALQLYRRAAADEAIPPDARRQLAGMAAALQRRC